jgi:IclR family KDG regulon transcriptional repressor
VPGTSVRAVERVVDILSAIQSHGGVAGISEISRELGLAKSTVHRILAVLTDREMVYKDKSTNRYSLGYKLFDLAFSARRPWDFISCAMPCLEEARDRLHETASIALRLGEQYSYVAQAVSGHSTPVTTVLGRYYPLHWGATGKAMLAALPDEQLQEYIRSVPPNGPLRIQRF